MMLTLAVTLTAVGGVQYALMAHALTQRASEQTAVSSAADAMVLRELHDAPGGGLTAVGELLNHIAARPGVHRVTLLGADGGVLAVGSAGHASAAHGEATHAGAGDGAGAHGAAASAPLGTLDHPRVVGGSVDAATAARVRAVVADGRATVDHLGEDTVVRVPVRLGNGVDVLEVVQSGEALRLQVADLRRVTLTTSAVGLLLAVPGFYVLGGRRLSTRHGQALETSSVDGLTGLSNHRTFHENLREQVAAARRQGGALTLVLVDLDGFKQVNDTHGHRRGDRVLASAALVLRDGVTAGPRGTVAYRIGGDEFALLVPAPTADALALCERIRAAVDAGVEGVTTSIGVAALDATAPDCESLVEHADAALYASKRLGRNRVTDAATLHTAPGGQVVQAASGVLHA